MKSFTDGGRWMGSRTEKIVKLMPVDVNYSLEILLRSLSIRNLFFL